MHWHGIYTARGGFPWAPIEDAVAASLRERGYRTWMPREHRPTSKRPNLTVPLVRGIVFVQAPVDWQALKQVRGYRRPLTGSDDMPAIITAEQIAIMREACEPLLRPQRSSKAFHVGERVRVRFNAIAEIEATIKAIRNGKATLSYEMIAGKLSESRKSLSELERI